MAEDRSVVCKEIVVIMSIYFLNVLRFSKNRLHESMNLFKIVLNYEWFKSVAFMLFLNKKDLFDEKLKRKPLNICFSDFKETNDCENGAEFIKSKFENLNERPDEKMLICHLTCATSTENIQVT